MEISTSMLSPLLLVLLVLVLLPSSESGFPGVNDINYSRDDFPPGFVFGAGTSAFQVEGAVAEGGRSPTVWDTYVTYSGRYNGTADVAADQYHKYKEDVKLMAEIGIESYRLSICWSRLIPNGRGDVNPEGLNYYNNLINELVHHGIKPHISLIHLNLPQILEDEYKGWLSPKILDDFTAYADVCFREFGDRVTQWTTLAEPNILAIAAYGNGIFPPQRCSPPFGSFNCSAGNSTTEPYIAAHHSLLAHTAAARLYKTKYQAQQKGYIGLNLYSYWCYPLTDSTADDQAVKRVLDFQIGWMLNPLVFGDYPETMKKNAGSRLPTISKSQSQQIKGAFDFLGLNHYTSVYVKDNPDGLKLALRDYNADMSARFAMHKNDTPGSQFFPTVQPIDPAGLRNMLHHIKQTYGNIPVYIEENGYAKGVKDEFNDTERVNYISAYIGSTLEAMRDGSDVKGYFVWSFMDVFEFLFGYKYRYGLVYVNFTDEDRSRKLKLSAKWYSSFLKNSKEIKIKRHDLRKSSLILQE